MNKPTSMCSQVCRHWIFQAHDMKKGMIYAKILRLAEQAIALINVRVGYIAVDCLVLFGPCILSMK